MKKILILLACIVLFLYIIKVNRSKTIYGPLYTLSANQLYQEYKNNEISADFKYKDNVVAVFGKIQNIGKDIYGKPYIIIGGIGFIEGAQCVFSRDKTVLIGNLSKGQYVKIKGEVAGKMINVILTECALQ